MTYKIKFVYIFVLLISVGIFNSCSEKFILKNTPEKQYQISAPEKQPQATKYGTYLAGRVAHIRQNYDLAADYYMKSLDLGLEQTDILSSTYLLLASEGRIDEAAVYALKARGAGDKSNLISFILMAQNMHQNNFKAAYESISDLEASPLNNAVIPLFESWILSASQKKRRSASKT